MKVFFVPSFDNFLQQFQGTYEIDIKEMLRQQKRL